MRLHSSINGKSSPCPRCSFWPTRSVSRRCHGARGLPAAGGLGQGGPGAARAPWRGSCLSAVRVADKVALHVGQAAEDGNHEASGARGGSAHGSASERKRARIHDSFDDGEQVESRAGDAVDPIAFAELDAHNLNRAALRSGPHQPQVSKSPEPREKNF